MTYWIKISYERNNYVIDLDRIAAFCCASNGRLTFSVPDSDTTIVLSLQNHPEAYQQVLDYVEKMTGHSFD